MNHRTPSSGVEGAAVEGAAVEGVVLWPEVVPGSAQAPAVVS